MKLWRRHTESEAEGEDRDQPGRSAADGAPQPQPEREEPTEADPALSDLSKRDYLAIIQRAGKETLADNVPMIASALAYSSFLAIPSTLLVATGLFTLVAGPDTISNLMQHLGQIAPKETVTLLNDSLQRVRYERYADRPDEIVVRSRTLLRTRRRVFALSAVHEVKPRERTVVIDPAGDGDPTMGSATAVDADPGV